MRVKLVNEGHQAKVKVTGAKKHENPYSGHVTRLTVPEAQM